MIIFYAVIIMPCTEYGNIMMQQISRNVDIVSMLYASHICHEQK